MLYTEEAVRANIRNREGKRVFFLGPSDQLTSAARDYLSRERIAIVPASEAKITRYKGLDGSIYEEKPEHMTQLQGDMLVPKTHPRIVFRGKLDSLEAELILAILELPDMEKELTEILDFVRRILRCEVLEEPFSGETLCGLTESQQRSHSHFPQKYYGQPHFMPGPGDGMAVAKLNRLRCRAREAELTAVDAFTNAEGVTSRQDLLRAMNRLSSMLYILMIRRKAR